MSRDVLDAGSRRVETILERFSAFPADTGARADAEELIRIVSSLHGQCLRALVQAMREELGDRANETLERSCADPLVASLLVTHGLHPLSIEERVRRAIEIVRPELQTNHADARLESVTEDVVTLRVDGDANVVPLLEGAVYAAAPEVLDVRCTGQTISLLSV